MITVLEDAKTLAHDPAAKAAVEKIKNVSKLPFCMVIFYENKKYLQYSLHESYP
jgi:hypothetical protein